MPIVWRLYRDHYGAPYISDRMWVAISGNLEVGIVAHERLSSNEMRWSWKLINGVANGAGWADDANQAKVALAKAWFDWIAKAGLRDDPDAQPMSPPGV